MARQFRGVLRRLLIAISVGTLFVSAIPNARPSVGGQRVSGPQAAAAPEPPGWLAEAQRSISSREYEATESGGELQAPNRAHGLRTYFEADGARVVDREDGATELARVRTIAINDQGVAPGEVVASGARVEVRRPGLVEWYENTERGLEQGWTIDERSGDLPLSVEIGFGAEVHVEGGRATVGANGRRLEYGGLRVWDATGETLSARLEPVGGDRLRILVDDADATYPVTIDPTLSTPVFTTLTGNQAVGQFGSSVAGAGDVNNDGYDDIVIGAPLYDSGENDEGAAFVFLGGPSGIGSASVTAASARLESNQASANMGVSVAGAGDVNGDGYDDVIVGADGYTSGQMQEGAAFVFLGGPSGIANGNPATAATTLQSNQTSAHFGASVASAGDVNDDGRSDVIVGALLYDAGQTDEGAAFVFLGSPTGIPSGSPATANTALEGDQTISRFGNSVAGAGDVNNDGFDDVIVGARLYDSGQSDEGAAFVFLGGASGIVSVGAAGAAARLESNQASAFLGASVAGAGDTNGDGYDDVIVGANTYDSGQTDEGAAFLFRGGPTGIASGNPSTAVATFQSDQASAQLGATVAGAGDVDGDGFDDFLVGAPLRSSGQMNEGAGLIYFGRATGTPAGPASSSVPTFLQQDVNGAQAGFAVAGAGDVNGDGHADVIVGAPMYSTPTAIGGAAHIYLGGEHGLRGFAGPDAVLRSGQVAARFGAAVSGVGDVNNDGYDDVAVGAPSYDAGQSDEGAVFVFHGGPNGIPSITPAGASTVLQSNQTGSQFGNYQGVAGVGDVNGDGYDDIVVGAYAYTAGQTNEGAAFVFHGGPSGIPNGSPATAAAILQSDQAGSSLGYSVAGAGDVNNDGYDDVVVGAPNYPATQPGAGTGAALVFHGGPTGVGNGDPTNADAFAPGQAGGRFGDAVAGAGDVNGDGYDDIVTLNYESSSAQIFIDLGSFGGVGTTPATILTTVGSGVTSHLTGLGDVNGDGYDDIIIGAENYNSLEGAVFIVHGSPTGVPNGALANIATTRITSKQTGSRLGMYVGRVGDVNNDGYADVACSTGDYVESNRQTTFVFLGGPAGVLATSPLDAVATVSERGQFSSGEVAGAGDVNGDGFDDLIVGYSHYSGAVADEGAALVYYLMRTPAAATGTDTVGIYSPSTGAWFLRNANAPGGADTVFTYGGGGGGLVPLRGDWDGDGDDTPGLYAPATGAFFLRNTSSPGSADIVFTFGAGGAGYVPMVGDWNGDGVDTIGLYAPGMSVFFLRNQNASGAADVTVGYGAAGSGWTPMAGDWDGDGDDTIGLYDPVNSIFFLRNANAPGPADAVFGYGPAGAGWKPVSGDFDGDGDDTVGLYRAADGFFFLRNANAPGAADLTFGYGPSNVTPLVGDWDGQ